MGYLFLTLALFAGVTKGYCGKKTSGYVEKTRDAFLINIIRMVLCTVTGIIVVLCSKHSSFLILDTKGLFICLLSGISTAFFVAFWLLAIRKSAYMIMDVFLLAGTLIPMLLSSTFFHESIKLHQWGGFLLLLIAVIIMCSYSSSVKEKFSISAFILLALTGIMCGITSFSQKLFVNLCSETPATVFNLYTYVFSAVTLIIFYFIFSKTDIKKDSYINFSSIPKRMFRANHSPSTTSWSPFPFQGKARDYSLLITYSAYSSPVQPVSRPVMTSLRSVNIHSSRAAESLSDCS